MACSVPRFFIKNFNNIDPILYFTHKISLGIFTFEKNREHTDYLLTLKQLKNKHDKHEFLYKEAIDRFEAIKNGKEKDKEARAEAS
ncbi:hypothetical protein F8M41_008665 [Gigaspora margarita]|uniref:Uncharacterized protein n=1 Tax=Gigaspora margarita TaxID=4874 RepID=A0A8H4A262_GIGMA|nr:hypothetical protein F8M41_008665 [Gigaspora margarita]